MCLAFSSSLFILKRGHRRREAIGGWNEGLFRDRKVHRNWRGGDARASEIRLETSEGLSCRGASWFLLRGSGITNAAENPVNHPSISGASANTWNYKSWNLGRS